MEKSKKLRRLVVINAIVLAIPIVMLALWIMSFNQGADQAERVEIYHSYFPEFLHGRYAATYLSLLLGLASVILSGKIIGRSGGLIRALGTVFLIIGLLMILLNLWGLM